MRQPYLGKIYMLRVTTFNRTTSAISVTSVNDNKQISVTSVNDNEQLSVTSVTNNEQVIQVYLKPLKCRYRPWSVVV